MAIDLRGMFANLGSATDAVAQSALGAPLPTDPMQRNAMQRAGVTNPMLQMMGQGLGSAMGADMRPNAAKSTEILLKAAQSKNPQMMRQAAKILGDMGDKESAVKLLALAEKTEKEQSAGQALVQETAQTTGQQLGRSQTTDLMRRWAAGEDPTALGKEARDTRQSNKGKQQAIMAIDEAFKQKNPVVPNQAKRDEFIRAVANGVVTPEKAFELLNPKPTSRVSGGTQFDFQREYVDSKGNYYVGQMINDPDTGTSRYDLTPVGDAPRNPVGALEPSRREEISRRGEVKVGAEAQDRWNQEREEIIARGAKTAGELAYLNKEIMPVLKTVEGGGLNALRRRVKAFFNVADEKDVDNAMIARFVNEQVLAKMQFIKGNPTEGERQFIIDMISDMINNPSAVTEDAITRLAAAMQREVDRAGKLLRGEYKTRDEYYSSIMFPYDYDSSSIDDIMNNPEYQ